MSALSHESAALSGLPARYRVLEQLGEGAQKRVYLAEDLSLERLVAIAAFTTAQGADTWPLDEARAMARVGHRPHVVAIYDVIEAERSVYIVSQYLAGGDLARELSSREGAPSPFSRALDVSIQLCAALEHAHEYGIVHCDLKPGNVLLDERGDVYLSDFGLAQLVHRGSEAGASPAGQALGTPGYAAPEQLVGQSSPQADLYSLGCILYELTTGTAPFAAESAEEAARRQQLSDPDLPTRLNPSLPRSLEDLILALLARAPENRPHSARDVRASLEGIRISGPAAALQVAPAFSASPRVLSDAHAPPLVSRAGELALLDGALGEAFGRQSGVILVSGEPGVGKSRLLRELRALAELKGATVLLGQGHEDLRLPYRALVDALLPLAARLTELPKEEARLIRSLLFFEIGRREPESLQISDSERHRLFVVLFNALRTWSIQRPLVLVMEDLHWVDSASLDFFENLATSATQERLTDAALLLIGSLRPVDQNHHSSRTLARLEQGARLIRLEPLGEAGIHEMLEALGIDQPSSQLVRTLRRGTGGNPLFIREVLRLLQETAGLRARRGATMSVVSLEDLRIPPSMTRAIGDRLSGLSETAQAVLTLAAALGTRFSLDTLSMASGRPPAELVEMLEEPVSQEVIADEGQSYHFTHPVIRQVLYQRASPTRIQRLHRELAERLDHAASGGAAEGENALRIAHHLVRAGPLALGTELVRHASAGADHALANFAWSEAAELLEAALAARAEIALADRAALHWKAGVAHFNLFDAGPCLHHLDQAIEAFRASRDARGLARALSDRVRAAAQFGLVDYGAPGDVAPLEQAIADLNEADLDLRARLTGTLAESHWFALQPARAEELARAALKLAASIADDRLCGELSLHLALACLQSLRIDEALQTWRKGAEHARRGGDLLGLEQCLLRVPIALYCAGRLREAEDAALEARDMNRVVQFGGDSSLSSAILVALSAARARFDAAENYARETLDLLRRARYVWSAPIALPALAYARAMRGDWAGANKAIDLLGTPGAQTHGVAHAMAAHHRALIDAYCGHALELGPLDQVPDAGGEGYDVALLSLLCAQVELLDAAQSRVLHPGVRTALDLAVERRVSFAPGWPFFIPRIQGVASALAGEWDRAQTQLEGATRAAEESGVPTEAVRSRVDLARVLVERGDPADRERAAALLGSAPSALARYAPRWYRARAQGLAAYLGRDLGIPGSEGKN